MAGQIRITPQELRDSATFLQSQKETVEQAVEALKSRIDSTTANWEGAAQSTFIESFESMYNPTLKTDFPAIIEGIMGQLNGAAEAIEKADEEVAAAFKG